MTRHTRSACRSSLSQRRIRAAAIEALESRRLLTYTAVLGAANFAGFTGDGATEGIQIDSNGTFLMHSRSGDPGFVSEFDFDSTVAGEQTLADDAANSVLILAGGGNDQLSLGSATFAALNFKANILFQGEAGTDSIFVFDLISSANRTVLISDQAAASAIQGFNGGPGVFQFNSVDTINYFGSKGSDTLSLLNLQATTTININTGDGADAIAIGGFDANAGTVNVDGGSAADSFTVLDVTETSASTYTINSGSVARGAQSYAQTNIEQVALAGGTAGDTINIVSSSASVVSVDGAGGGDAYNVGNAGTLDSIAGAVSIADSGASGTDSVTVNDSNDLTDNTYILIAAGLLRAGNPQIGYGNVEGVTVSTGQGNDSVSVAETQTAPTNIFTGTGNDIIALAGATNGLIDANGGTNDVLDYTFAPVGVTVNLPAGTATGTTGVGGFEGVIGSGFNDNITVSGATVLGSGGDDVISVLGSSGASLVDGGEGGDAVILGNGSNSLDDFTTLVTIADTGTTGTDLLLLNDSGDTDSNSYTFVAAGMLRNGIPLATYSGVESVTLVAGTGGDIIFVAESQVAPLTIFSGDGGDTIGLAGFTNGTIDADGGTDTLDYSAAPIAVFADLQNGIALGTTGIAGFEVVNGSGFDDSFVASDLGSTLNGNGGNDFLRGGAGSDVLNGGAGNDDLAGLGGVDAVDGGDDDDVIGFTNVDGLDFVEGGNGNDQLFVLGAALDADGVSIANNFGRLNVVGNVPVPFGVDAGGIEFANIILQGGNDVVTVISSVPGQQLNLAGNDDDDIFIVDSDGSGTPNGGTVDGVAGPIFITGDGGTNILALDDSGDATGDVVTVTPTDIGAGPGDDFFGGGSVSYAGLKTVTLFTSNAANGDLITVTPSGATEFSINAGSPGNPTASPDLLIVKGEGLDYTIGAATFTSSLQTVAYTGIETLGLLDGTYQVPGAIFADVIVSLDALLYGTGGIGGGVSTFVNAVVAPGSSLGVSTGILSTLGATMNAGTTYQVDLNGLLNGVEHDLLNVIGSVVLNNANIAGTLGYSSLPGDELMIIHNDGFDPVVGTFAQGSQVIIGGQKFAIDYAYDGDGDGAFNDVALIRSGAATAADPSDPTKTSLFVSATTGADRITFNKLSDDSVQVLMNNIIEGTFNFTGRILVFGQSGDDILTVSAGMKKSAWMWGGVGRDTFINGGDGEENIMIGGVGDDRLLGDKKNGIFVGGAGADFIQGGDGDDLIITGITAYDNNTPANRASWAAIQNEWLRGSGGYTGHVSHLTNGSGLNGSNVLNATTVFNDGAADTAEGGKGREWFIAHTAGGGPLDVLTDRSPKDEQLLVI